MCGWTACRPAPRRARSCAWASSWWWTWCPRRESLAFRPEAMALAIVFEDEHLLVLDKPAGLVVHPAAGNWSGTLLNGLLAHHADAATAAARRHRAPARQGHLGPDGGGQDPAGHDGAGARDRRARGEPRSTWRWRTARWPGSRRRFDAPIGRDPVSRVKHGGGGLGGKTGRTDASLPGRGATACPHCAAPCTPGARTRSACTWPTRGHPLVADTTYGGRAALGLAAPGPARRAAGLCAPRRRAAAGLRRGPCRPTWHRLGRLWGCRLS